jgi:hypothetical protein
MRSTETAVAGSAVFVGWLIQKFRQSLCGLRGHDNIQTTDKKRIMLRCSVCQYDSPGWVITGNGPRRRFEGDTKRHRL